MAGDTPLTLIGNLTADPELRFTAGGDAVANITVASTPRTFDRQSNEWVDGETLFLRGSVWREQAENVAESLRKGDRVIVQGRLKSRSFETKEGDRRTVNELDIDEVGPSLRYAQAKATKTTGGGQGGQQQRRPQGQQQRPPQGRQQQRAPRGGQGDPWTQQGGGGNPDQWTAGRDDEPPF